MRLVASSATPWLAAAGAGLRGVLDDLRAEPQPRLRHFDRAGVQVDVLPTHASDLAAPHLSPVKRWFDANIPAERRGDPLVIATEAGA